MNLTLQQIDAFFEAIEREKAANMNSLKQNNIDDKQYRSVNQQIHVMTSLQSSLLRLRKLIKPPQET